MAFSPYKTIRAVVKDFQIFYMEVDFIVETPIAINHYFREDLEEFVRDGIANNSEYAICENLIAPILKEIWKLYKQDFLLWSHETFRYNDILSGVPDYILAVRSFGACEAIAAWKNRFRSTLFSHHRSQAR